jgi:hypothetical protein
MAIHSQDIPHTMSAPETSKSPHQEEEHIFPEIYYALPHKDLNQLERITRDYARQIGALPLALLLPHRKQVRILVVDTLDQVFVHKVEDLIYFTLTEIEKPLNLIPEIPAGDYFELDNFESDEEGFNSDLLTSVPDDMEDKNDHNEERGNPS